MIIELAAGMAFVGMTVYFTRKEEVRVLKGSVLASMCALDDGARAAVGGLDARHAMSRKARFVGVKLNEAMDALVLTGDRPETAGSSETVGSEANGGHVQASKRAEAGVSGEKEIPENGAAKQSG